MFRSRVFTPLIKKVWHAFRSCATSLLLAIILTRANAYSRALAMLHLSGTINKVYKFSCTTSAKSGIHGRY